MGNTIINKIIVYKLDIPFNKPARISLGTILRAENVLVQIYSSDGLVGTGEGAPIWYITGETQAICFEALKTCCQLILNKDPYEIESRIQEIDSLVHNPSAKSAVDMALYDLLAKRAGLPFYALLGGQNRVIITDRTVSIDEPEIMAQNALDFKGQGFQAIKVKLGIDKKEDITRIRTIRDAIGPDIPLRLDANQGWNSMTAELMLKELAEFNIEFCEQPVAWWNFDAMKYNRERSPIPIMADESLFDHHDAYRLASMGACDYLNIKLAKSGGIHTALKINAVAEAAGMHCMVGCMTESRFALTAAAHLASARPNVCFIDLDSYFRHAVDPVIGGMTYRGCEIHLPDTPGHGAEFDPGFLAKQESVSFS